MNLRFGHALRGARAILKDLVMNPATEVDTSPLRECARQALDGAGAPHVHLDHTSTVIRYRMPRNMSRATTGRLRVSRNSFTIFTGISKPSWFSGCDGCESFA